MKSKLQTNKSILAKLLASENITINHLSVRSSHFDLKTRTLTCPLWKDMDGELYDLLLGHEVAHALNTPVEGWSDVMIDENGNSVSEAFKSVINILEDARIEKKIKRKYPGIAKSFTSAYKSLHDKNFFGIIDVNINSLNFIDRINIYIKLGAHITVNWRNDWEREILSEVQNLETWEEVVELAKRIFSYVEDEEDLESLLETNSFTQQVDECLQETQEAKEKLDDIVNDDSECDVDLEIIDVVVDNKLEELTEDLAIKTEEEIHHLQNIETSVETQQASTESSITESITDSSFRKNQKDLIDDSGHVFILNLPDADLNKIIMPNSLVMNDLEKFITGQMQESHSPYSTHKTTLNELAQICVGKFNNKNRQYIMHIFKEFNMRKRAPDYARTSISRTGELNMSEIYKYKLSTDVFKKNEVVQKGKCHGLIMFVDMSGSMIDILSNTIEQTLILISFCKLANIPFDVYAFSNDHYQSSFFIDRKNIFKSNSKTEYSLPDSAFHLKHLISSSFNISDYRRSFNNLSIIVNEYSSNKFKKLRTSSVISTEVEITGECNDSKSFVDIIVQRSFFLEDNSFFNPC